VLADAGTFLRQLLAEIERRNPKRDAPLEHAVKANKPFLIDVHASCRTRRR
jgi:hypothetical protein